MAINQGFKNNDGSIYVYQENTTNASISSALGIQTSSSLLTLNLSTTAGAEPGSGFQPLEINPATGDIIFTPGVGGTFQVDGTVTISGGIDFTGDIITTNSAVSSVANSLIFEKDRAGAVIVTGDDLGQIYFKGFDGTAYVTSASIRSDSSGTIAANRVAGSLVFATHPDSASGLTPTDRFTIAPTGAMTIATPDSGLGLTIAGGGLSALGTTTINTTGAATTSIGSITGASGIAFLVGTGNYSLDGVTNSTYTVGASTTTGTITIGGTAQTGTMTLGSSSGTNIVAIGAGEGATTVNIATGTTNAKTISIGTGAAMANTITLGGTGANVITIGNTQTAGSISLGAAMTTGTVSIGGSGLQTGTIQLGYGTGAQSVLLGTGGTGIKTITIGGTAANVITIGDTQTAGSISLGAAMTSGTISIGGTGAQTGTIAIAPGTGAQTVTLGNGGTAAKTINIGNGAAGNTISIGNGVNTVAQIVNISNGASGANSTVNILTGAGTAGTQTFNVLATGATRAGAVNIGTGNAAHVITIGTGGTGAVNIGNATGNTAVTGSLAVTTNLLLPTTSSTVGQLLINNSTFLHAFGTDNAFVGFNCGNLASSGANQNTGMGSNSLATLSSGDFNSGFGRFSLNAVTTGSLNTACGDEALAVLSTGSRNTAIGYNAGGSLTTTDSSNICIGSDTTGTAGNNNTLRIGAGAGTGNGQLNRAFIHGIRGITTGNADAIAVLVDSAGQLGTLSSSIRFKENVRDMGEDTESIMNLRPVIFNYKEHPGTKSYGLIAEEVLPIMPDLVVYNAQGEIETVKYQDLAVMLLNEVQKLKKRLDSLECK